MKIYVNIEKTLSNQLYMIGADDWFEFKNGKRTNNLLGARVKLVLPLRKFEKVSVKILSKHAEDFQKNVDDSKSGFVLVKLIDPEAIVYMLNQKMGISIKANDIEVIN